MMIQPVHCAGCQYSAPLRQDVLVEYGAFIVHRLSKERIFLLRSRADQKVCDWHLIAEGGEILASHTALRQQHDHLRIDYLFDIFTHLAHHIVVVYKRGSAGQL